MQLYHLVILMTKLRRQGLVTVEIQVKEQGNIQIYRIVLYQVCQYSAKLCCDIE